MKKTSKTIQWIFTAIFGICTLANGFHISTFLLLLATVLLMPIEPIRNFLKDKIKVFFDEKIAIGEDWLFFLNYCKNVTKAGYLNKTLYCLVFHFIL